MSKNCLTVPGSIGFSGLSLAWNSQRNPEGRNTFGVFFMPPQIDAPASVRDLGRHFFYHNFPCMRVRNATDTNLGGSRLYPFTLATTSPTSRSLENGAHFFGKV